MFWPGSAEFRLEVREHRSRGIDHQVRLRLAEKFIIRMRDAGVVPDRVKRVQNGRHSPKDSLDVLGARAVSRQRRMTLPQQLQRAVHRGLAIDLKAGSLA